ncbi:uncharacterized protein [Lolium perenne]|uniref:uncharacterized protein isoform X2 n=1 Tax=Lolium perenne TaxID=4522 RepID=UPI003A99E65B
MTSSRSLGGMVVQAVAVMGVSGWFMTANNLLLLSSDDAGYENAYGKPLEGDILTAVLEHLNVQLASHPCEDGGHRRDAGLGEGARLECLGRRHHGRWIGRLVLHGSAGGGGQEDGLARIGDEWPVLAGPTRLEDFLMYFHGRYC